MMVDAIRWRSLTMVAKETGSEALAAEATHFSADFVGSALVLVGLIGVWYGIARWPTRSPPSRSRLFTALIGLPPSSSGGAPSTR